MNEIAIKQCRCERDFSLRNKIPRSNQYQCKEDVRKNYIYYISHNPQELLRSSYSFGRALQVFRSKKGKVHRKLGPPGRCRTILTLPSRAHVGLQTLQLHQQSFSSVIIAEKVLYQSTCILDCPKHQKQSQLNSTIHYTHTSIGTPLFFC